MAERKTPPETTGTEPARPRRSYPWHEWMDGSEWEATQGEDFDTSPRNFGMIVREAARRRGLYVWTRTLESPDGPPRVRFQVSRAPLPDGRSLRHREP